MIKSCLICSCLMTEAETLVESYCHSWILVVSSILVVPQSQSESYQNIIHILQSPLKLPLSFIFPFVGGKQFICHLPLTCDMEGSALMGCLSETVYQWSDECHNLAQLSEAVYFCQHNDRTDQGGLQDTTVRPIEITCKYICFCAVDLCIISELFFCKFC